MLTAILMAAAISTWRFDLAAQPTAPDRIAVQPGQTYQPSAYGFEPGGASSGYLFSAAVPEGVYRVTIRFGGVQAGRTTVKAAMSSPRPAPIRRAASWSMCAAPPCPRRPPMRPAERPWS